MNDFSHTIRNIFKSNDNLNKLLLINVIVFLTIGVLKLIGFLVQSPAYVFVVDTIVEKVSLPASFSEFIYQPWSLFSYMFLHSSRDIFHIIFNMLWLYWMGRLLQDFLGTKKLLLVYIWGGISGGVLFLLAYNFIPVFVTSVFSKTYVIGASGAVLAVMTAIATLVPNYEIQMFLFGRVKLKWIAIVMIAIDFLMINGGNAGGHITHLGGALFGYLYVYNLKNKTFLGDALDNFWNWIKKIFKPKKKSKFTVKNTTTIYYKAEMEDDEPSQEEVDEILDKISQSGYGSLSEKEKNILFKASKQL